MTNSYISMLLEATLVSQLVLVFLILMSLFSWTIIFFKIKTLSTAQNKTTKGTSSFENASDLRTAVQELGQDNSSPLYTITQRGVEEFNSSKNAGLTTEIIVENVNRTLEQSVAQEITDLSKNMSLLATCANTAPFIGLFGTVWGILNSFHAIGLMKSASLATVAPGIAEALIATAVGLFVAIPASIFYNIFIGKLGEVETSLSNFRAVFLNRVQRDLGR